MRILIDECIDERLRALFRTHDCQTVREANLAGFENGRLLEAAEAAGFEVLITVDQHIPEPQSPSGRMMSVLIFCAPTNRLRDLAKIAPAARLALPCMERGSVVRIT
jgi:hypothetical protein